LIKKIALSSLIVGLLSACSGTDIDESLLPMELVDFQPSLDVSEIWSVSIGSGADETSALLRPVLSGDTVYVSDHNGRVTALDVNTGRSQWSINLRTPISGGVGIGDDLVLLAGGEGEIYALEQSDGSMRWQNQITSEILSAPQAAAGVVVVAAQDGRVVGLDSQTGEQIWRADAAKPLLTVRGNASPTIVDTVVLIGHDSGRVGAYRLSDGAALWIARVAVPEGANELQRMVDVDASVVYANGLVYGLSFQGGIMAIDPQTGRGAWFQETSSVNEIGIYGGTLAVTDDFGKVTTFSSTTGEVIWESEQLRNRGVTGPVVHDLAVAVADFEGYLHLFRRSTGTMANRTRVSRAPIRAPLVPIEDGFLVLDTSGRLTAIRIGDS
jgi:outer membrane protein assembly factor BamB